jgi:hypothetical protein
MIGRAHLQAGRLTGEAYPYREPIANARNLPGSGGCRRRRTAAETRGGQMDDIGNGRGVARHFGRDAIVQVQMSFNWATAARPFLSE